jgi:hypothetical protein
MNIITAIREGRLFDANELIREGLNRSMLSAIYSNCPTVMKEAYGGPGAGVIPEDEIEYVEECDDMDDVAEGVKHGFKGVLEKPGKGKGSKNGKIKTYSLFFDTKSEAEKWVNDHKSEGSAWVIPAGEISDDVETDDDDIVAEGFQGVLDKRHDNPSQGKYGTTKTYSRVFSDKSDAQQWADARKSQGKTWVKPVNESIQLDEARDKAGWQAYIGRLNASVVEKQHQIAGARQRVADLRRKKAKPESIAKANEAIAKKQAGLGNLKKRVAEAQKKYQEWLKKEAEKAKKAREKAAKARKTAAKKPTTVKK